MRRSIVKTIISVPVQGLAQQAPDPQLQACISVAAVEQIGKIIG